MTLQLILIDESERDWKFDERTKQVGLAGVQAAREALKNGARRRGDAEPPSVAA